MPRGSYLGPYYLWQPPQTFPHHIKANILTGVTLVVLIMISKCTSATTIRNFENTRFITHKCWRVHSIPGVTWWGHKRELQGHSSGRSSRALKRGVLWIGWPGSLSSCAAGHMFIWGACLWMDTLPIRGVMSGTYITFLLHSVVFLSFLKFQAFFSHYSLSTWKGSFTFCWV